MLKLYKMSEEEKREMNFSQSDNYYSFKQEDELLGFAKINILKEIDIFIFILEERRGNGFGNELYSQVLEILKKEGANSFTLMFPLRNVIMRKIVEAYGAKEDSRQENKIRYQVFI